MFWGKKKKKAGGKLFPLMQKPKKNATSNEICPPKKIRIGFMFYVPC